MAPSYLFFGSRNRGKDYYYGAFWEQCQQSGVLAKESGLVTAFSRDQHQKVYVQHRIREQAAALWAALQQVCKCPSTFTCWSNSTPHRTDWSPCEEAWLLHSPKNSLRRSICSSWYSSRRLLCALFSRYLSTFQSLPVKAPKQCTMQSDICKRGQVMTAFPWSSPRISMCSTACESMQPHCGQPYSKYLSAFQLLPAILPIKV